MSGTKSVRGHGDTVDAGVFEATFHDSPCPTAIFGLGGGERRINAVNRAFAELLGYRTGDLLSRRLCELIAPGDLDSVNRWLADLQAGERTATGRTLNWLNALGGELSAQTRVTVAGPPEGRSYAVVFLDGPSRAPSPFGDMRKLLQDIIDGVPALVFIKDLDHRYTLANRWARQLFGAECVGLTDADITIPEEAEQFRRHDLETLAAGEPREFEEWALHDGDRHVYYSLKFPLLDHDRRPYALCGVSTDITGLKRAEAAAREARDEAERANRAKSALLSRVSHELRTPLHSVLGYCQLLQVDGLSLDVSATAARMASAAGHLLELINDLLEVSRIEQGQDHVRLEPVHACDPVNDAVDIMRPLADARDVELAVDLHGGLHEFVLADRRRLHQVLLNLMSNGVNYNRPGGQVRVSFRRTAPERLRLLVSDTGAGIARQDFERVFMPFERLDGPEHPEGAGLGLAVSKSLIEAMNGTIGIESSQAGHGTTLFVELQLVAPPANAHELVFGARSWVPVRRSAVRGRVLYIEDHAANVELIRQALGQACDVELLPADRGETGLRLAGEMHPDLILLDLHLPDVPGETVLVRLKEDPRTSSIPVVVLSADATPGRVTRAKVAGADHYLTKPLDLAEFLRVVEAVLDGTWKQASK
ncbi:MAG TPA: ATP-binding protein [Pseudonocardia sp.]|nr:ATP-binding protein [Pseudonocardia sp.]